MAKTPQTTAPPTGTAPIVQASLFRSIGRSKTLSDEIAFTLREKIRSGELPPGAQLPTEMVMAEAFGVSRNVIREAIARLKLAGFIETTQGVGSFVAQDVSQLVFTIEESDLLDPVQLQLVFALRIEIETAAAGLAAANRTESDLAVLRAALAEANRRAADLDAGTAAAIDFHSAIGSATNNPYFVDLMRYLQGRLHGSIRTTRRSVITSPALLQAIEDEHCAIYEAISRGDVESARSAMRDHLNGVMRRQGLAAQDTSTSKRERT
ncbi:transcriptional regulator of GntR family [Bosea sp. BIWAKO-01]|nr:transcriptional regulator of GntR family [Bosea sp. BIWAKO-01]